VRRLPIVVREYELVGMLAQADVARVGKEKSTGEMVEAISQPPGGPRVAGSDADDGSNVGVRKSSPERRDRSGPIGNALDQKGPGIAGPFLCAQLGDPYGLDCLTLPETHLPNALDLLAFVP